MINGGPTVARRRRAIWVIAAGKFRIDISIRNILQSTRSLYDFRCGLLEVYTTSGVVCYVVGDLYLDL